MTDLTAGLLPPATSTGFELAQLEAMARAWGLDFGAVARQSDPLTCDAALLPFLFFDRGGTVWSDAWPEAKKRQVVRDLFTYKRLEGTPRGLEAYLNLADSLVFREVLPPAQCFAIPDRGLTADQVRALMPQLRLYHRWPDRPRPRATFTGGQGFAGRHFAIPDVVGPRGRYPVLWDRGAETPLNVADAGLDGRTVTLSRPGTRGSAAYAGRAFAGRSFFGRPAGGERITFDLLGPEVVPVHVAAPLNRAVAVAGRGCAGRTFARRNDAGEGDYDRLYLNDPTRIPTSGAKASAAAFAGASWLGLPAYHVLLRASVPGDRAMPPRWRFAGQGFAIPERNRALRFAMQAANAARRAGDRVLIELNPTAQGGRINPLPNLDPETA